MAKFTDEDGTTRLSGGFAGPIVVADGTSLNISGTNLDLEVGFNAAGGQIRGVALVARNGNDFAAVIIDGTDRVVNLTAPAVVWRFATAAPSDDLLSNGGFALWLDATNGASKLMVKAKSANGTVVTGSLNLS